MTDEAVLYRRQLHSLMPPGRAFAGQYNNVLDDLLGAVSEELKRVDLRGDDLINEAYPNSTDEMLPDWERVAALPSTCMLGVPQTKDERRKALTAKLSDVGDVTPAGIISFADTLGYVITLTEFKLFEAGHSSAGDPVCGDDWVYVLLVNSSATTILDARAGEAAAGDALRTWGNERLECSISEIIQAHWYLLFAYEEE